MSSSRALVRLATIAIAAIILSATAARAQTPIILALDGIANPFLQLFPGYSAQRTTEYLGNALGKVWDKEACSFGTRICPIVNVFWSGQLSDAASYRDNIKIIIQSIKKNQPARPMVIVAHSWGSVVAFEALRELENEEKLEQDEIAALITLGSPLTSYL